MSSGTPQPPQGPRQSHRPPSSRDAPASGPSHDSHAARGSSYRGRRDSLLDPPITQSQTSLDPPAPKPPLVDYRDGDGFKDCSEMEIGHHLLLNWPHCATDQGSQLSGIACLTVVIRIILAHLSASEWNWDDLRAQELQNPFLKFAWLSFDPDNDGAQQVEVQNLAQAVWERALDDLVKANRSDELSFESLVNSARMSQTVWAWPDVQLYREFVWKRQGDTAWTAYDPVTAPPCVTGWLSGLWPSPAPRDIESTLLPTTDLTEEMNDKFYALSTPSGSLDLLLSPNLPPILHATFVIGDPGSSGETVSLDQIRHFHLEREGVIETPDGPRYGNTDEWFRYNLLAIVKYRQGEESDLIRVFDVAGHGLFPFQNKENLRGYATNDLKIETFPVGTRLFLLYGRFNWPGAPTIPDDA